MFSTCFGLLPDVPDPEDLIEQGDKILDNVVWMTNDQNVHETRKKTKEGLETGRKVGEIVDATNSLIDASRENLDWSIVNKEGEDRYQHVSRHGVNDLEKKSHGVFYGDPVETTNEAWANKGDVKALTQGGVDIYHIKYQNSGYAGGKSGHGQNLNHVTIITKKGTNKIITSYPSSGQ